MIKIVLAPTGGVITIAKTKEDKIDVTKNIGIMIMISKISVLKYEAIRNRFFFEKGF